MSREQCRRGSEAVERLDKAGGFRVGLLRGGWLKLRIGLRLMRRFGPGLMPRFSPRLMSEEIFESVVLLLFLMSFAMDRRAVFVVGPLSKYAQLFAAM
jgi:hypothetical protein